MKNHHNVTMGSHDRYRRTGWHHDEGLSGYDHRDGSHVQYPSSRTHNQSSRLGHGRYGIKRSNHRNNLELHRTNQAAVSNRPNHNFLVKSKHLKRYLLKSLRSHIKSIEEWLPDNEYREDDSNDGPHSVEKMEDMDWQLEREIVVQGYVWSSEILPVSRSDEDLEIKTPGSEHEKPCGGRSVNERASSGGCTGVGWEDQKNEGATEIAESETAGHGCSLSQLAL